MNLSVNLKDFEKFKKKIENTIEKDYSFIKGTINIMLNDLRVEIFRNKANTDNNVTFKYDKSALFYRERWALILFNAYKRASLLN
jgi:hypothetical protein